MKTVIAISNQKGGVGKTTTAAALAVALSRKGERVHVIDLDPQGNLSTSFGLREQGSELYQSLRDETALPIMRLNERLSITPSSAALARGESEFLAEPAVSQFRLQACLGKTELEPETIVLIDCPPSLGILSINGLVAGDRLLVAVTPGRFELDGLKRLQGTVDRIKQKINPELHTTGIILCNCDMRKKVTMAVLDRLTKVYPVLGLIRRDAQLQYACGDGMVRFLQPEQSHAMGEYAEVADRLKEIVWQTEAVQT